MVSVGSSPGGGRSASNSAWIIPPAAVAAATVAAVVLVAEPARLAVALCGAVATAAVALSAGQTARRGRTIERMRREHAAAEAAARARLEAQETEMIRLADHVVPAAILRLHKGRLPEEVMRHISQPAHLEPSFAAAHHRLLKAVLEAVSTEENLRDAAQRAFVNIARRVQAIVHQQAMDLRTMEDRHGNEPQFFNDLLHIDHGNALVGRLADSIAVLGSSHPGRVWRHTIPLYNVLRGAMSRILEYKRVSLHSVADVGIVGPTVEPLIHAVAELLDNATRYSPPNTKVHLTATEVQTGVAVEIEDAGVGLNADAKVRVDRTLEQALGGTGIDLDDLGENPRLGLSVVGRLAKDNNFIITMRQSAYGGVRAVVVVPETAVTITPVPGGDIARAEKLPPIKERKYGQPGIGQRPAKYPEPEQKKEPEPTGPMPSPPVGEIEIVDPNVPRNANGLPQRRRRMPLAPGEHPLRRSSQPPGSGVPGPRHAAARAGAQEGGGVQDEVQPGIWLADFMGAVNGGADDGPERPAAGPDQSTDDKDE